MSLPSSSSKCQVSPSHATPLQTILPASSPTSPDFENSFLGTPTSTSSLLMEDSSVWALYVNPSNAPVDPITPPAPMKGKAQLNSSEGTKETTGQLESAVSLSQLGPPSISDLPEEKGKSYSILAHGDQLTVQSLIHMALGESRESQEKTIYRRKLKKRIVVEEEVQLENILDLEGDEVEKEIDEDIARSVKVQHEKMVSQPSTGGRTRLSKRLSTKKIIAGMKRNSIEMLNEDVPEETSKYKLRKIKESSMTKAPDTSSRGNLVKGGTHEGLGRCDNAR
ncbi:hypothetical protein HAX54_033700 [Datura stramonium]|uniref:Uncharacterized protein n=1 Tax=Datura stramonium TaxID=4076 RepID=A0ABS8VDV5_DATST|nr:hypothetical protein [Datura stramonium]